MNMWGNASQADGNERFSATYLIETPFDPMTVCAMFAGEQSTSSSRPVPGESTYVVERHGARIESLVELGCVETPSLPVIGLKSEAIKRARVKISWPMRNIGPSLPMLWTTVLGNGTGIRQLTGIRLEHIELPPVFVRACPSPRFGVAGTRTLTSIHGRPIVGTVVKPNVGLSPHQTADVVRELVTAGVDFIKDDELLADAPYSSLEARVESVMPVLREHAERSGTMPMYAFNITGDIDEMRLRHDLVLAAGGTCVMVNINAVGLSGLLSLRRHTQIPIHGHRAGWGAMTRFPMQGLDFDPYQLILRLAGVDHLHVSGLGGKFWESSGSVVSSAVSCLTPILDEFGRDDRALPVLSGGSTVWDVGPTYSRVGSKDLIFVSGSGIMSHPHGSAAGYSSLRAAWDAALEGTDVRVYARHHPELATALEYWRRSDSVL